MGDVHDRSTQKNKPSLRDERSAGFVLFRVDPGTLQVPLYLLLDYGTHWDYAKGHVEAGEDDLSAARRELDEETGLTEAELVPNFARELTYVFRDRKKRLVRKTVVFFLARTSQIPASVRLSHEHVGFEFLPFETALKRLTHVGAKELLRLAHAHWLASVLSHR